MHHVSCYALTVCIRPKSHRFLDNHRCRKGEILEFERNGTWHWCCHIRKECLEQNEEESNRMRELKTLSGYRSTSVRHRFITTAFPPFSFWETIKTVICNNLHVMHFKMIVIYSLLSLCVNIAIIWSPHIVVQFRCQLVPVEN